MAWLKLLGMPDVLFRFDIVEVMVTDSGTTCESSETPFHFRTLYLLRSSADALAGIIRSAASSEPSGEYQGEGSCGAADR
jgi:hypothetical protein